MSKPQQPELRRSSRAPTDQDAYENPDLTAKGKKRGRGRKGEPIPADNRPGHHPPKEQDKPEALGGAGHGEPPAEDDGDDEGYAALHS